MSTSAAVPALRWLVRDTFRQSFASGIFWLMLGVSVAAVGLGLAVHIEVAAWLGDAAGLLLPLVWTAGFLPSFLEPDSIPVLLAKPVRRWALLAGKCLGVLVFVAFQALVFVGCIWLALGFATGNWSPACFLCLPLLLLHFGVFFGFSALLAVATRSTVACLFGTVLFWLLCWAVNFGRHALRTVSDYPDVPPLTRGLIETVYWLLPKPLDFHFVMLETLGANQGGSPLFDTGKLSAAGAWYPALSLLASALAGLALLGCAVYEFLSADY
jgi:ABC-type transport system involved in multi-copper enzyme maturation permease subunit